MVDVSFKLLYEHLDEYYIQQFTPQAQMAMSQHQGLFEEYCMRSDDCPGVKRTYNDDYIETAWATEDINKIITTRAKLYKDRNKD